MPPKKRPQPAASDPQVGPLATILGQIDAARSDLSAYRPGTLDWHERARQTAEALVPWLTAQATGLKGYVQDVLNAPMALRGWWRTNRKHVNLPKEQLDSFDRLLALDDVLRESVTGEVISNVVTKYLLDYSPDGGLASNGRSDYPDLYRTALDYTGLPAFVRKKAAPDDEYGAATKGTHKRPVRVPDGLEIKTCRERIAVDCHYPHAGLHLVLLFAETARTFAVSDIRVAFLRRADYRVSERNTESTTVKYSFNGDRFVSLLNGV
jgi:hypothetical protein